MRVPYLVLSAGLLGLSGGLAACESCANVNCSPCTSLHEDVQLVLDGDSTQGGYREAELRGAYVVRYRRPGFTSPRDTVRRQTNGRYTTGFNRYQLLLGQLRWPRGSTGPRADSLVRYNYRVVLPAARRQYDLSELELRTRIGAGTSCCSCPENERRRYLLNGQLVVADGSGESSWQVLRR